MRSFTFCFIFKRSIKTKCVYLAASIDGLVQDYGIPSKLAMAMLQSCTKLSICHIVLTNEICIVTW